MTTKKAHYLLGLVAMLGALSGCSSDRSPEPTTTQNAAVTVAADAGAVLPGYVHDLSRSRFRIGTGVFTEENTNNLVRQRGSLGAFALNPNNGWTMGIVNGSTTHGPYVVDEAAHSSWVKAYFTGAGIPADQVGEVFANYGIRGGGATSTPTSSTATSLNSMTSVLTRVASGIRVVESYAWARETTAGDVDMESVFWPPIDLSIVNAATSLQASLSDAVTHASFLAKLPGTVYKDVGVVIHHSSPAINSAPVAYVSYDVVLDSSPSADVRHFDASGLEFRLPHELLAFAKQQKPSHAAAGH